MLKVLITAILITTYSSVQDGTKVLQGNPRILELKDRDGDLHWYTEWQDSLRIQEDLWCQYHLRYERVERLQK